MKNSLFAVLVTLLPMSVVPEIGYAAPGDANGQPGVEMLEPGKQSCPAPGSLCLIAGAPTTLAMAPSAIASMGVQQQPAQFVRVLAPASQAGEKNKAGFDDSVPWTLELHATLRRPALAGNALFLLYDAEDKAALLAHEVTGMWQATVPAGDKLSARLSLSPDDGFHAGRTYLIRVAQIIHGQETILAEGEARLM